METKVEAAVAVLESRRNKKTKEISTEVKRDPNVRQIIVPEGMTLLQASKELAAMHQNEEQILDVDYTLEGWDWKDALVAVRAVSENAFGWLKGVNKKDQSGQEKPREIDIVVDVINNQKVTTKGFMGQFVIGTWDKGTATVGFNNGWVYLSVKAKKKFSNQISKYFADIEKHLSNHSIYKGKTVVVTKKSGGNGVDFDFEIVENKGSGNIVLNPDTQLVLDKLILPRLHKPGKKCYLFTGQYGNAKTETAMGIGRKANTVGISFFYLKDAELFDQLLNRCKRYQPAIVFVEDIDEIGSGEERGKDMNKILNTIDGVQTKGNDITVIFTTNHEKKINPAMRRPGRIDQILNFANPTKETRSKIMRMYFDTLPGSQNLDYNMLAEAMGDLSGSLIAEMCKRAVEFSEDDISNDVVEAAIISMQYHIAFMNDKVEGEPKEITFVKLFKELVSTSVADISNIAAIQRMEKFAKAHGY